jgi:hypothetical protein
MGHELLVLSLSFSNVNTGNRSTIPPNEAGAGRALLQRAEYDAVLRSRAVEIELLFGADPMLADRFRDKSLARGIRVERGFAFRCPTVREQAAQLEAGRPHASRQSGA